MEKVASLCGCTPTYPRGPHRSRAADLVQGHQVRLPCFCHQPKNERLASVLVLFSQSQDRKAYPRAGLRLPLGQGTDPRLDPQCRFLPALTSGFRHRSLLQAALPAQELPLQNSQDAPHGTVCPSGPTGAINEIAEIKSPANEAHGDTKGACDMQNPKTEAVQ